MKKCTKCGVEKEATTEYFLKCKTSKCGLRSACKTCVALYRQENKERIADRGKRYYQENKEHIAKQKKRYRQENKEYIAEYRKENKEYIADRVAKYHQKNKDYISKQKKQYRKENKERIVEYGKRYCQENPEKCAIYSQRRRARKRQLDSTLTFEQWENIKEDFNHKCAYCGKEDKLAQEHFLPLSKGGEYTHNNIIPACKSCNSSKHDKLFHEWYPNHKNYSKKREKTILKYLGYDKKIQQLSIL